MDFSFSEEQTLLQNSVARYLADNYTFETWRKFTRTDEGRDPDHWKVFAELGLAAAPLPDSCGGLGGGPIETMIVMKEFGRALVIEPYVPTVIVAGGLLARAGTRAQQEAWLPKIAAGRSIIAFAFAEPKGRYNLAHLATTAKKQGNGYLLNGYKAVVIGAPWADALLVTARTAGSERDAAGVSLFLVDKSATGISTRDYPTVEGGRACEITFENVALPVEALIGPLDGGLALIEQATDEAIVAHCAEAVGAMGALLDTTVAYSKQRKQFGKPIGSFQVLQHRMVDMFIQVEQATSITLMATLKLADHAERAKSASAAKVQVSKAARFVGQQAIQIHGGMGMTDELAAGHYFKRLTMLETLYGDVDHHLARFATS
ncbi:MAG: acyl-CoA dehydrogenase family protein [Alphaproteobacteria bacterium]|nr:acyl-CoA dehydrogenase family protein [Alphaproteobacteria bacterium]